MAQDSIKCPNCGSLIPLSEALSHDKEERARLKYQAELEQSKKDFQDELVQKDKELQKWLEAERKTLSSKIDELDE